MKSQTARSLNASYADSQATFLPECRRAGMSSHGLHDDCPSRLNELERSSPALGDSEAEWSTAEPTLELAFERERDPWLVEIGSAEVSQYRLLREGEALVVGSGTNVDVRVDDRAVSQRHCRLRVERGRMVVEDLGSKNGIFVGGGRVVRAQLTAGTSFVMGRAIVTCDSGSPSDEADEEVSAEPVPGVIAGSLAMRRVIREMRRLAAVKGPVLLRGETGTGKDVLARALHQAGPRRGRPFVALNVGALPRELAEAELFGHEKGAFTGAFAARDGAFVEANGGTLFLDEIAELAPDLQVKLLRVLEDFEVRRIGGRGSRKVDVRIASATWAPLDRRIEEGRFRLDLYQRLAVFIIDVPPLRERRSDILSLAEKTLRDLRDEVGPKELSPAAAARLAVYKWPGNVRELRNVVYRAAVGATSRQIRASDIATSLSATRPSRPAVSPDEARAFMARNPGSVSAAARKLGVQRSTLRGWMKG